MPRPSPPPPPSHATARAARPHDVDDAAVAAAAATEMDCKPETIGFYTIDRRIGKGNFAEVRLATHRLVRSEASPTGIESPAAGVRGRRRVRTWRAVLATIIRGNGFFRFAMFFTFPGLVIFEITRFWDRVAVTICAAFARFRNCALKPIRFPVNNSTKSKSVLVCLSFRFNFYTHCVCDIVLYNIFGELNPTGVLMP